MDRSLSAEALPPYGRALVAEAIDLSGFPIVIAEEEGIGYDDVLALAVPGRPYHKLSYVPSFRDHRLHFVVNACYKIRRVFELPPEDRLVPVGEARRRLPPAEERELQRRNPLIPPPAIPDLSLLLCQGLLQQVVSMPFDIRVERDIADSLPEHAEAQRRYLERQVRDLEPHFDPRIARFTPAWVYSAISAMNVVLSEEASEISGAPPGAVFGASPHRALGLKLQEQLRETVEPGLTGDRLLTDRWAETLGVADWYEWKRLDSVR